MSGINSESSERAPTIVDRHLALLDAYRTGEPLLPTYEIIGQLALEDGSQPVLKTFAASNYLESTSLECGLYGLVGIHTSEDLPFNYSRIQRLLFEENLGNSLDDRTVEWLLAHLTHSFSSMVSKHVKETTDKLPKGGNFFLHCTPYDFLENNDWHQDGSPTTVSELTYTSVLFGPKTRFASEPFADNFTYNGLWQGSEPPYVEHNHGDVIVHSNGTLHAAPGREYEGVPRLFLQAVVNLDKQISQVAYQYDLREYLGD